MKHPRQIGLGQVPVLPQGAKMVQHVKITSKIRTGAADSRPYKIRGIFPNLRRGWTPAGPPGNGPRLRTGGPVCRPYRKGAAYGGRVRTPAPTRIQGRPHLPRRGRSQTGPVCRPYIISKLSRGAPWGSRQKLPQPRVHPHPAGRKPATFPLVGGRLAGGHMGPPLRGKRSRDVGSEAAGAGIKSHQSQFSSCSGPLWGRTEWHPSTPNFARRKGHTTSKG